MPFCFDYELGRGFTLHRSAFLDFQVNAEVGNLIKVAENDHLAHSQPDDTGEEAYS